MIAASGGQPPAHHEEDTMGSDERDRKRQDEPDVEAHKLRAKDEEPKTEPEDKADDDAPDVEGHMFKR